MRNRRRKSYKPFRRRSRGRWRQGAEEEGGSRRAGSRGRSRGRRGGGQGSSKGKEYNDRRMIREASHTASHTKVRRSPSPKRPPQVTEKKRHAEKSAAFVFRPKPNI